MKAMSSLAFTMSVLAGALLARAEVVPQRFLVFPQESTSPPWAQALTQFVDSWNRVWATRLATELGFKPEDFQTELTATSFKSEQWDSSFIGYFDSKKNSQAIYVNRDILETWPRPWSADHRQKLSRVLAHEWQHRILHQIHAKAGWWVHEGLSTLWEYLYFGAVPVPMTQAMSSPDFHFKWDDGDTQPSSENYARAFLGTLWIYRQHEAQETGSGKKWLQRIYQNGSQLESMDQWLEDLGHKDEQAMTDSIQSSLQKMRTSWLSKLGPATPITGTKTDNP
jgi:hypothetical protein